MSWNYLVASSLGYIINLSSVQNVSHLEFTWMTIVFVLPRGGSRGWQGEFMPFLFLAITCFFAITLKNYELCFLK